MDRNGHREFLEEYLESLEISCYCVDLACGEDTEDDGYIVAFITKDDDNDIIKGALKGLEFEEIKPLLWCQKITSFEKYEYFEDENINEIFKYIKNKKEEKIDEIRLKFSDFFSQNKKEEYEIKRVLELRKIWNKIGNQLKSINVLMRCKASNYYGRGVDSYNFTLLKPETKMIHLPFEFVLFLVKNDNDMFFFIINIFNYFKDVINIKAIQNFISKSKLYKSKYEKIKGINNKEIKKKK